MGSERKFENYEVLEREDGSVWELGRGAMGVTYKAFDTDLHCAVALKVINPAILDTEGTEQRFLREARAAAQLRHPNIATVLRLGKTEDGTHFYAMEFCDGRTVDQFVAEEGPLPLDRALDFTLQVARALVAAEEQHVVHRDIKPANLIVMSRRGEGYVIKVIDFGLAKSVTSTANSWTSMSLATAGFIGTAHFSSPEQLEEGKVDVRSDIYSLGATLWFMLTGEPIFGGSVARVMSQHLSASPPWERLDSLGLSPSAHDLLKTMLAKKPEDRPQNALDLKQTIESCLDAGKGRPARPVEPLRSSVPSADVLGGRWKLLEEHRTLRGSIHRAVDLKEDGRIVGLVLLDEEIREDAEAWGRLERLVESLQNFEGNLVCPITLQRHPEGQPFLVAEWINGLPLVTLLRRRSALSWKEVLKILGDIVPVYDLVLAEKLETGPFCKEEVSVSVADNVSLDARFDELMQKPATEWPGARAVINLLPLNADAAANQTLLSMATMLPGSASANRSAAGLPRLRDLGLLVYELLGGSVRAGNQRYVPITRIGAGANEFLKSILDPVDGTERNLTGAQFAAQLSASADSSIPDQAIVVGPIRRQERNIPIPEILKVATPPRMEAPPAVPTKKNIGRLLIPLGIAAAAILVGALIWLGIAKVKSTKPAPVAAATPAVRATPPLEGNLISTEYAPKGDIRVEHRSGGWIYLISRSDETKRYALQRSSTDTTNVLFSPDENWFVLNEHAQLNNSTAGLYHRVRPNEVEYIEAANVASSDKSLTDAGWQFYLKEVGLPDATSRNEVRLSAVEWNADSSGVRLRFDNFGANGQKIVPQSYVCVYQVGQNQFRSESDTSSIRSRIAAAAAPSISPPAALPETAWKKQVGDFVTDFVHINQSTDSKATTDCYAPVVDYFDQGRVDHGFIETDVEKYNVRWPTRHDDIENNNIVYQEIRPGAEYLASFNLIFFASSPARLECVRGKMSVTLHITVADGPKISSIQQKTLQHEKGVLQITGNGFTPVWGGTKQQQVARRTPGPNARPNRSPSQQPSPSGAEIFGRILNGLSNGRVPIPPHP